MHDRPKLGERKKSIIAIKIVTRNFRWVRRFTNQKQMTGGVRKKMVNKGLQMKWSHFCSSANAIMKTLFNSLIAVFRKATKNVSFCEVFKRNSVELVRILSTLCPNLSNVDRFLNNCSWKCESPETPFERIPDEHEKSTTKWRKHYSIHSSCDWSIWYLFMCLFDKKKTNKKMLDDVVLPLLIEHVTHWLMKWDDYSIYKKYNIFFVLIGKGDFFVVWTRIFGETFILN